MDIQPVEFVPFFNRAFDGMEAIADQLGDDLINVRPALPGANSAYTIIFHCAELTRWWVGVMGGHQTPNRDRDAEFVATGSLLGLVQQLADVRNELVRDVAKLTPQDPILRPDLLPEGSAVRLWNQGEALIHAYEEVAQHHGQLELTRDWLLAR